MKLFKQFIFSTLVVLSAVSCNLGPTVGTKAQFGSEDFLVEVALGRIPGHSLVTFFGHNPNVTTGAEQTIWPCGNGADPFIATASTMTLSSGDSTDNQAGVGLTSVLIQGLDTSWVEASEFLSMHATDGQLGTTTVNTYIRINAVIAWTTGSSGKNAGIVYIGTGALTAGVPANVHSCIAIGANFTETGIYSIPVGKTGFNIQAQYGGESNKNIVLNAYQRNFGLPFWRIAAFNLSNQNVTLLPLIPPASIPAKSDIHLRGTINTGTGDLKSAATLMLVEDDFLP